MLKRANTHFYCLWWITFFKNLYSLYVTMECIELNWLYKQMKKVRSYGCLFVAKLSWNIIFFWTNICVFYKINIIWRKKNFLYGKKSFIMKTFFTEKNFFFIEKNINDLKNLIWKMFFYRENVCVTNKI